MEGSFNHTISQKFFYDSDNTPVVTNISKTKLNILGGELITINGTSLPNPLTKVFIGEQTAKIISSSTTQIVIETPQMGPGVYDLIIPSGSIGNVKLVFK